VRSRLLQQVKTQARKEQQQEDEDNKRLQTRRQKTADLASNMEFGSQARRRAEPEDEQPKLDGGTDLR
jgi:hypothetical protein